MSNKKGGTVTIEQRNIQKNKLSVSLTGTPKKKYQLNKKPKHYTGFSKGNGRKITASDIKRKK